VNAIGFSDRSHSRLARQRGTAFVIGEGGLLTALHENGYAIVDQDPDYVVVSEGRTFNLEMVEAAVRMILRGAKLIATNLDPNCPTPSDLRPGCGALVALLEVATGVRAFRVGKPSPVIMRAARKELGLTTEETTIIGDTMETDVLGGVQLGFHTILVLSGGTSRDDLPHYAYGPERVVESVADLADFLEHSEGCPLWQIPEPIFDCRFEDRGSRLCLQICNRKSAIENPNEADGRPASATLPSDDASPRPPWAGRRGSRRTAAAACRPDSAPRSSGRCHAGR